MTKAYNMIKFMKLQHECSSLEELSLLLDRPESQVKQTIEKYKELLGVSKIRPYPDMDKTRGRKKLVDQIDSIPDFDLTTCEEDDRREQLEMDNEMRMELAVK